MNGSEDDEGRTDRALAVEVGRRIAALRARRGVESQQELATRAGMAKAYVWRLEAGRQDVSLRNLARLCRALDVTLSELLDGIDVSGIELENRAYGRPAG